MNCQFPIIQIMDGDGNLVLKEFRDQISGDFVKKAYKQLLLVRNFDRKAISLQRQGRLGTYAPFEGQEAAQVGSALALSKDDWMFPTYRDHAASITFGHSLPKALLYWNGRLEGCIAPEGKHIFPPAVPIATQLPHATGAALAEKKRGTKNAAIAYFGDGATSEGDFHEGINIASVFKAPVVFFNQNNQFAISVPIQKQMNSETIAQKSVAYNITGYRIDGNDIFAVYFYTKKALEQARNGGGPTLIEAVTWRYGAHTTADDPKKYRNQEDNNLKRASSDPVLRLERYMKNTGLWDERLQQQDLEEIHNKIEHAVKEMEAFPPADVNDLFDHVFETAPWNIQEQKNEYFNHLRGETV
ncbi:pyruvate dehydrogenase (acetyl-transferring) E1 component subunit alpha [Peribacillus sp. B-H-3]|uniref:pyruvate dehydrogenase (acetyl-transferring) E1 component subunit alpha n=1 Tax=Peribacillus sp. B-H-3 TaxID=3400420 RepID=UPI003B01ED16